MNRDNLLNRLLSVLRVHLGRKCRAKILSHIRRLENVRDPDMRGREFLRVLAKEPGLVVVEMLYSLDKLARDREPGAQKLYLSLLDENMVNDVFSKEQIYEILNLSRLIGYQKIAQIFFYTGGIDNRLEETPSLPPDIKDIPLGRRKAMARVGIINVLERLLKDNNADVIRNLLANPRITEREVIFIAARRPNTAAILRLVASDHRWVARYSVKKALVYNPYTPISISVPLLKFLVREDLVDLSYFSSVNDILKREAREILETG